MLFTPSEAINSVSHRSNNDDHYMKSKALENMIAVSTTNCRSTQFASVCMNCPGRNFQQICKDCNELIFWIRSSNQPFFSRCFPFSNFTKHTKHITLISLVIYLMNHVTFLALPPILHMNQGRI